MNHTFGDDYRQPATSATSSTGTKAEGAAEAAEVGLDHLRTLLFASYIVLLVVLPAVSYLLARRALKPVEKSFSEQQRFVDDASHELRTPLSILQGELELAITKRRSSDEYQQAIRTSLEEVERLTSLVNNLLLMARGSHDQLRRSASLINLQDLIRALIHTTDQHYVDKQLLITANLSPCTIQGIPALVEQSIGNILDNAAKFSKSHGRVTISLIGLDNTAIVKIVDEGPGMTTKQVKQVFDRFWRAENARSVKGFGLGLPLVQQIMSLHGGSAEVTSLLHRGTTVTLTFPKRLSR